MATQQLATLEETTAAIEASGLPRGPKRGGFYCPEGECYFVYLEEALSYAERVDDLFTVYKAVDGDRLVGFEVKCTDVPRPHGLSYRVGRKVMDTTAPIEAVELVVYALQKQGNQLPKTRGLTNYVSAISALGREPLPVHARRELCAP